MHGSRVSIGEISLTKANNMLQTIFKNVTGKIKQIRRHVSNPGKLTQREYEASLNALNIFFGAIIGVSLGNIEKMPTINYVVLLLITASIVSTILVVSYSHRRFQNMLVMILVLAMAWYAHLYLTDESPIAFPEKLLPTLSVWAAMAIMLEFTEKMQEPDL